MFLCLEEQKPVRSQFWRHGGFSYTISIISYHTTSCVWVSTSYTSLLLVYPLWLPFMLSQWLHLPVFGDTVCLLTTFLGGNLKITQNNGIINIIIIIWSLCTLYKIKVQILKCGLRKRLNWSCSWIDTLIACQHHQKKGTFGDDHIG